MRNSMHRENVYACIRMLCCLCRRCDLFAAIHSSVHQMRTTVITFIKIEIRSLNCRLEIICRLRMNENYELIVTKYSTDGGSLHGKNVALKHNYFHSFFFL